MVKLQEVLKEGRTYQIFLTWDRRESWFATVNADLKVCDGSQYTCRPHDEKQLLECKKRKGRKIYLPYHCIRYIEVSPASDAMDTLFG